MKILFFRHGESQDDIEGRYGGWADFILTEAGRQTILSRIENIKVLQEQFQAVFASTLQRAYMSAEVVSQELKLPLFPFEFLKEKNNYGILSGMIRAEAEKKYPELVEKVTKNEYIYGAERYEDLVSRVKKAIDLLSQQKYENIIAVTHGNFMKCVLKEYFGKKAEKVTDGGFFLVEEKDGQVTFLKEDGILY